MKEKKESDSGEKAFGRIIGIAVIGLLSVFLLTGCSQERMETRREIDRIYKAAEQTAEDRAAAYITEKYGLENAPDYHAATPAEWSVVVKLFCNICG